MLGIAASGLAATDAKEADLVGHRRRLDFERLGGRGAFLDQRRILLISIVDLRQCARNLRQAAGLLAARLRDFSDDFGGLGDGGHHFIERRTGFAGERHALLHFTETVGDQRLDVLGGLGGALGETAHLGGDDRKAAAGLAGARRLDRGIERKQIGLARDLVDHDDNVGNLVRGPFDMRH